MLLMAAVLASLLGTVGTAHAGVTERILRDCADDGVLQGDYSPAQLRQARKQVKGDLAEYSDCSDIIGRAADRSTRGGSGNGPGGPGGPGSPGGQPSVPGADGGAAQPPLVPTTPQDRAALEAAGRAPEQPVTVAGSKLLAGASPLREGYRANGLPDSLIVALGLLALAGVALSLPPVRRRLLSLRRRP